MCVVYMTVPGVAPLQLLLYALLLGVEFVPDDLGYVGADLVLQEPLALTHVVQPVVLGQAEQFIPLNVFQPGQVNAAFLGEVTNGGFHSNGFIASTSLQDPVQHPHIVSKTRPQEFPVLIHPEPVHMEDLGHLSVWCLHVQPVL